MSYNEHDLVERLSAEKKELEAILAEIPKENIIERISFENCLAKVNEELNDILGSRPSRPLTDAVKVAILRRALSLINSLRPEVFCFGPDECYDFDGHARAMNKIYTDAMEATK